ncbi:MAG: hypothetical protein HY978_02305 [Candidatus Liptonbacteria bacterium]|nr:hypothetical protein [Candidatus Liptonbacteria bacterium]
MEHFEWNAGKIEQEFGSFGRQLVAFLNRIQDRVSFVQEHAALILEGCGQFHDQRQRRAREVRELRAEGEIKELSEKLLPDYPAEVICMDGRMGSVRTLLLGGGVGSTLKSPGGKIPDCIRGGTGGSVVLQRNSSFARNLEFLIREYGRVCEILVPHLHCAAQGSVQTKKGLAPKDGGALDDVVSKKRTAEAIQSAYAQVYAVQLLFDPDNGFGYMGHEIEANLDTARSRDGFTHETVQALSRAGKMISTELLAEEFKSIFKKHGFEPDWGGRYKEDLPRAWQAIDRMRDGLLPKIKERVLLIYPELADGTRGHELEQRAGILLLNAFAGYLNNVREYKFGQHQEQDVRIGEHEFGPFPREIFSVDGSNLDQLANEVGLAIGIVRKNRADEKVPGAPDAPVSIRVEKVTRNVSEEAWDILAGCDFFDLVDSGQDWRAEVGMSGDQFRAYLSWKMPNMKIDDFNRVFEAINRLRGKMSIIFRPHGILSEDVMDGHVVVFPALVDDNRQARIIFPFFLSHYTPDSK